MKKKSSSVKRKNLKNSIFSPQIKDKRIFEDNSENLSILTLGVPLPKTVTFIISALILLDKIIRDKKRNFLIIVL